MTETRFNFLDVGKGEFSPNIKDSTNLARYTLDGKTYYTYNLPKELSPSVYSTALNKATRKQESEDNLASEKITVLCVSLQRFQQRNQAGWKVHAFNHTLESFGETPKECIRRFKEALCRNF